MRQLGIVVAVIGLLAAVYLGTHRHAGRNAVVRTTSTAAAAPALTMIDLGGNKIDTAGLRGNVVLINFWAAWCTPCTQEVPQFIAFQEKFGAQGFQIIGISMEDKETVLRDFYKKSRMNYPVVIGNQAIVQQYGGILGLPTSLLIGRDGRIHHKYAGVTDFAKLEHDIVMLLQLPK